MRPGITGFQANLHLFSIVSRRTAFEKMCWHNLSTFANDGQQDLVGANFTSFQVRSALQTFVAEFLAGLSCHWRG